MEPGEYLHIVGLGDTDDWKAGRGSIYYIEDGRGKIVLPVFTTPERARKHTLTFLDAPETPVANYGTGTGQCTISDIHPAPQYLVLITMPIGAGTGGP